MPSLSNLFLSDWSQKESLCSEKTLHFLNQTSTNYLSLIPEIHQGSKVKLYQDYCSKKCYGPHSKVCLIFQNQEEEL